MSTPVRYDEQYCPVARALDALGDRWTMLVLRELVDGEQRFTDLKQALVGITPAVLSTRLKQMVGQGLVREVPEPGGRRVRYAMTERGRAAQPVMSALSRFGMELLEEPGPALEVDPRRAARVCVATYFDPVVAAELDVDERYAIRVDGAEVLLSSVRGASAPKAPVVVIDTSASTLFALRQGRVGWDDAIESGTLAVTGSRAATRRMRRLFGLDHL